MKNVSINQESINEDGRAIAQSFDDVSNLIVGDIDVKPTLSLSTRY